MLSKRSIWFDVSIISKIYSLNMPSHSISFWVQFSFDKEREERESRVLPLLSIFHFLVFEILIFGDFCLEVCNPKNQRKRIALGTRKWGWDGGRGRYWTWKACGYMGVSRCKLDLQGFLGMGCGEEVIWVHKYPVKYYWGQSCCRRLWTLVVVVVMVTAEEEVLTKQQKTHHVQQQ